jgi:crotonobetainyl-CoA:carnitine CoA-transferase CaiB-like acyl-CoA transferase
VPRPLAGVRIVEFCTVAAGRMLPADMGADVIEVEHPREGDRLRRWPPLTDGFSEDFASLDRNKRSVTLDLKKRVDAERADHSPSPPTSSSRTTGRV